MREKYGERIQSTMGILSNTLRRISRRSLPTIMAMAISLPLSGCGPFGGGKSNKENITYVTSQSVQVKEGAKNVMCNNAMTLTILGVQKRPISTFAGASVINDTNDSEGVNEMSSKSIVVEIDMSITFNDNTFRQITQAAGGDEDPPDQIQKVLVPGSLIFISGTDPNGGDYRSYTIIQPETEVSPSQAVSNSQWKYNILDEPIPEASETLNGSLLFKVSAKAKNLQFNIYSPYNNAEPLDEDSVRSGNNQRFVFNIDTIE